MKRILVLLSLPAISLLVACTSTEETEAVDVTELLRTVDAPDDVGPRVGPLVTASPADGVEDARIGGIVGWSGSAGDCVYEVNSSEGIVWPYGTEWDDVRSEIVLPTGERLAIGDTFISGGGHHNTDRQPADGAGLPSALLQEADACGWQTFIYVQGPLLDDASPEQSQARGPVDPEDRLVVGSPLISVYEYCYGECSALARTPRYAVYDDGRFVQTGYLNGGDFFMDSTTLSTGEVADLVELARQAGLNSGVPSGVGDFAGADGAGTVFVSEVGERTTLVHAPHLDPLFGNIETDQQAALLQLATELDRLSKAKTWEPAAVEWAISAHRRSSDGADDVVWPGPSLDLVDASGCLMLGSLDGTPELERLVDSADATFGLRLTSAGWSWRASVRPMMPHETGCEDITAQDNWFWATNDQVLAALRES